MMRAIDSVRGIVCFKASGENIYRFINGLRESLIICTSQHCRDGFFYGQIYRWDLNALNSLAEKCGIDIEILEKKGIGFRLSGYRFRFGILIGLLAVVAFIFYLSNTVVSIEVCGNTNVTETQIISALEDIGIYKGKFIPSINFRSCEQRLRLSIPDIAWTGIRHTGSRIVVDITETVEPPEMILDEIPCNIVAAKDAQLTYCEVYAGQLIKQNGDGVKKGDIIISGTITDGGDHIIKKHAMGKVIGIYKEEYIFEQPFEETGQVYSEKMSRNYFSFFGFRIPLFLKSPDVELYEYSESETQFYVLGKEIPLGIVRCTFTPFSYETLCFSEEEADQLLQQKTALHEKNFYDSNNIEIIERKIEKNITEEKMEYKISYVLEGDIAEDHEIFVD